MITVNREKNTYMNFNCPFAFVQKGNIYTIFNIYGICIIITAYMLCNVKAFTDKVTVTADDDLISLSG